MRALLLAAGLALVLAAPASAYHLTHVVPQPQVRYFVALKDWRRPMARAVRAVNRAHVGVRLVKAKIAQNATVQIGRLEKQCGLAGVDGTTQSLEGGYAVIYLPRGCGKVQGTIIAAHELGHALGLKHEDRRCALMNAGGTGPQSIPQHCVGDGHDWLRRPFRADDLAGLRKLYRNVRPRVSLRLSGPASVPPAAPSPSGSARATRTGTCPRSRSTTATARTPPTSSASRCRPGTSTPPRAATRSASRPSTSTGGGRRRPPPSR